LLFYTTKVKNTREFNVNTGARTSACMSYRFLTSC
jgi:hypothetical protein